MEARFTALVLLLSLLFVAASASAFIRRGEEEQQAIHMKAQQATKGQQAAAEMTGDDCTTWYEQTDHGSAFRNAKDFGAKGDGVTDDTVALQHALTDGRSPQFSTKTPLVVYLPPGTYLVSDTLDLYFYTHLIGNYKCRPTIRLQDNSPGFASGQKYVLTATMDPSGQHVSNFYHQIHHVNLDLGEGNPMAIGIHWAVAQATSLRNMTINVGSAKSAFFGENGGGGFLGDLEIIGGDVGMMLGGQQWTLRSITIANSRTAGISFFWNWVFVLVDMHFYNCSTAILAPSAVDSLVVMDSSFTDCQIGISTSYPSSLHGLVLDRIQATRVPTITNGLSGSTTSTVTVRSWSQGHNYVQSQLQPNTMGNLNPTRSDTPMPALSRPADFATVFNVRDAGAKGDGVTDDTAAIASALQQHDVVFFPYGTYVISSTINLTATNVLIGEVYSLLAAQAGAPAFASADNPNPMLRLPAGPNSKPLLMDLMLTATGDVPGCVLLEWNSGPLSAMYDVHYRLENTVWALFHMTASGAGYIENSWMWIADHDIDTGDVITIKSPRGLLCESQGPTYMYGTAVEHNYLYNYNISGASNVHLLMTQTETPYWQSPPTAWGLTVTNSNNIWLYGTGYYSWFNGNQTNIAQVVNSQNVSMYAHNVYGAVNALAGDRTILAVYNDTFCAAITTNLPVE
eukprot:m.193711 g.193711  ORF g.193711 m.193711 type:complete len:682 (-) comp16783_c2_seq13:216-2261(-)